MKYIAVRWKHQDPDEPILLYCEIDDAGWEVRKVDVYRDGRIGYADESESMGDTWLASEPVPPLAEIASDPQFEPTEITKDEFEQIWSKRLDG